MNPHGERKASGTPMFSVCIAVRDRPAMLVKSINSVLAGTFDDFEIIVVDDGSAVPAETTLTDAGLLRDDRITVLRQEPSGIAAARNTALKAAIGRYVTVLDSDDELAADGLTALAAFLKETGATWVYTDYEEIVNGLGRRIALPAYASADKMRKAVLVRSRLPFKHSGMTIERDQLVSLGGYDELMRIKVDVELVLRALSSGVRPRHLAYPVVRFHRHGHNISRNRKAGLQAWFQLIDRYAGGRAPALLYKAVRAGAEAGKWAVSKSDEG
jgi:glycosyltransferase involved in cell wall biosynthesis